jgi:hypothetical protein
MGLVILPTGSCPEGVSEVDRTKGWCGDFERENWGWRWMLRLQGALVRRHPPLLSTVLQHQADIADVFPPRAIFGRR